MNGIAVMAASLNTFITVFQLRAIMNNLMICLVGMTMVSPGRAMLFRLGRLHLAIQMHDNDMFDIGIRSKSADGTDILAHVLTWLIERRTGHDHPADNGDRSRLFRDVNQVIGFQLKIDFPF